MGSLRKQVISGLGWRACVDASQIFLHIGFDVVYHFLGSCPEDMTEAEEFLAQDPLMNLLGGNAQRIIDAALHLKVSCVIIVVIIVLCFCCKRESIAIATEI